jgi:predicted MPP superfamily phosphohydrolase
MPIFVLSILIGIPLLSLVWWWWADRRLRNMNAGRGLRIGLMLAVVLLLAAFVWVIFARREIVMLAVPAPLYALVLIWGLICLPFLGLPSMLGWSFWKIGKTIFRKSPGVVDSGERPWTRREWLKSAAVALPVMTTFGTGGVSLPLMTHFRIREITVTLRDLPPELDGLRIAHLTDTHVGKFTKGKVLDELVAATNRLKADLVLFTGDLIDNTIRDLPAAVKMLQGIEQPLFVVEGNHDLFDDPAGFEQGLREGGIALLRNQAVTLEIRRVPVQILGMIWNRGESEMARNVNAMATLRDPAAFPILLAHHPHVFDRAAEQGFPLTLAGHTHGGQLMMSREIGAGPAMFRYWSGLYQRGRQALVVSNGAGNWFPLRVNSPAEIIHLTLRRENGRV